MALVLEPLEQGAEHPQHRIDDERILFRDAIQSFADDTELEILHGVETWQPRARERRRHHSQIRFHTASSKKKQHERDEQDSHQHRGAEMISTTHRRPPMGSEAFGCSASLSRSTPPLIAI